MYPQIDTFDFASQLSRSFKLITEGYMFSIEVRSYFRYILKCIFKRKLENKQIFFSYQEIFSLLKIYLHTSSSISTSVFCDV